MPGLIDDTIAAVSTPAGEGGIGIVRLSGGYAAKIADKIFVPKSGGSVAGFKSHTVHYGHIVRRSAGAGAPQGRRPRTETIDEVLLTFMRAPGTYTKEDIIEINCHGGLQATKKVLDLTLENGARLAEPGEFTKRAFLNGRLDLSQAEAVLDTIRAKTEGSLKTALKQLEGGLSKEVNALIDKLADITADIEASIDFPDEDIEPEDKVRLMEESASVLSGIKGLIDSYGKGMVMREGVLAIICGKPNVGKSSLMNLLLKRDRVIVSPIPGTTRDAIEEMIDISGLPIRLVDTAGIGAVKDPLGRKSANKTRGYMGAADIALLVLDGSRRIDARDREIFRLIKGKKKLVIINKCDLGNKVSGPELGKLSGASETLEISVKKNMNIALLEKKIEFLIWGGFPDQGESPTVANARHKELLDKAYKCVLSVVEALKKEFQPELLAVDLKEAIFDLGLITGKSVSGDILNRIFEKFCVGK